MRSSFSAPRKVKSFLRVLAVLVLLVSQNNVTTTQAAPAPVPETPAPHYAPGVSVAVGTPGQVMLGQDFTFTVTFDNTGTDPGYGPFIDIIMPVNGADGNAGANLPLDGIDFISADYQGQTFSTGADTLSVRTFPGPAGGVTCTTHAWARNASGNHVQVCGPSGDKLISLRLPFGSFTPDQPLVTVTVKAHLSNLADLGTALTIKVRGGYMFGADPLDNWCCGDPAILIPSSNDGTGWPNGDVTPILATFTKTYVGPSNTEDETATGPNFPRQYRIAMDIADGQTINALIVTDTLPANVQYVSLASTSPAYTSVAEPSTSSPGGTLNVDFVSVTGTTSTEDVIILFNFYIPRLDSVPGDVISPTTGNDVLSENNVSFTGLWLPIDVRDQPAVPVSMGEPGPEHTLVDKSIAIQKDVTVVGGGEPAPGKSLEYTLDFQVSDFFAFDTLSIWDVISDGQHFDPAFTPTLLFNGNAYNLPALGLNSGNYSTDCFYTGAVAGVECSTTSAPNSGNPNEYGTTQITFDVSGELGTRGHPDGRMVGGCVDPINGSNPPDCSIYNDGATTATLVFRTIIQENFTDNYPSGDPSVDQGDTLDNYALITGRVLNTANFNPAGDTETDDATAGVLLGRGELNKSIYAINGLPPSGNPAEVKPGDTVTYRLEYPLITSDVENLYFEDFLPLPAFYVGDPDANDPAHINGPLWVFDDVVDGTVPAPGHAKFGPTDTFRAYSGIVPTPTRDIGNNLLTITYGTYDDTRDQGTIVDILFTVTVSVEPFADRLYLTNQALAHEGSTNAGDSATTSILPIILTEPVLTGTKSVFWTDNPNGSFNPSLAGGGVSILPPANEPRWSGTINSTWLDAHPINSNLNGVDASDVVTFAITIRNTGSSLKGAFDIALKDTLPPQFQYPGASVNNLNLQVYYGNGTGPISYTGLDTSCIAATSNDPCGAEIFGGGIQLIDPVGEGVCQAHDPNLGNDIILITYDLQLKPDVTAGSVINTVSLLNYAGDEGGPNHLPQPQTDDATVNITSSPSKYLLSTSLLQANFDDVAVGEIVSYRVVLTIPEGLSPDFQIRDLLPTGLTFINDGTATMAFVSNNSITSNTTGIVTGIPNACNLFGNYADGSTPAPPLPCTLANENVGSTNSTTTDVDSYSTGDDIYFKLGDLVNTDNDVDPEYVIVEFKALVENSVAASNDNGDTRDNLARAYINGTQAGSDSSAVRVRVIEPVLQIAKTADDGDPASGQIVHFTMTLAHDPSSLADAYDVIVYDDIPTGLVLDTNTINVTTTGGISGLVNNSTATRLEFRMDTFPLGATLTVTYQATVTAAFGQTLVNSAITTWTSLPGSDDNERTGVDGPGGLNDYFDQSDLPLGVFKRLSKSIDTTVDTNSGTTFPDVTIGELITYQVVMTIPPNSIDTAILVDNLATGLAFVDCEDIVAGGSIDSSNINLHAAGNCVPGTTAGSKPLIENAGRRVTFDFGTVTNTSDSYETITIRYRAVVLDIVANQDGVTLDNDVTWTYGTGSLTANANSVNIVESSLAILKSAEPRLAPIGSPITFTITVGHIPASSHTTAFDVIVVDDLPAGLAFIPGTLNVNTSVAYTLGNTAPPHIEVEFPEFPVGTTAVITFQAQLRNTFPPAPVENTTSVVWTSLSGPVPGPISPFEQEDSHERNFNPANTADDYGADSSVLIRSPYLPSTGFAPGRITNLPLQPASLIYAPLGDVWLEIPRLGVKTTIVGIPQSETSWDISWLWDQAGYLDGTAYPSRAGNSVLTGHVYLPNGKPGPFIDIHTLRWGDQIIIHAYGQKYTYQVRTNNRVSPSDTSALKHEQDPWLTLITCQGFDEKTNSYTYRIVVRAVLVKVESE